MKHKSFFTLLLPSHLESKEVATTVFISILWKIFVKGVSCESCDAFGFKLAILLTNVFFKMQSKICKPPKKHISVAAFESGCFLLMAFNY